MFKKKRSLYFECFLYQQSVSSRKQSQDLVNFAKERLLMVNKLGIIDLPRLITFGACTLSLSVSEQQSPVLI